jgi:uncharacterized protein YkwD
MTRMAALGLAAAPLGLLVLPAPPVAAQAGSPTRVIGVELGSPAVIGEDVSLQVDARDPDAPVSGMVVRFGSRGGVFGISACRAQDPLSGPVGPPFSPGSRVRMTAPHRFRKRGRRRITLRLDSGGCMAPLGSIFQQVTVTPTAPGERPVPLQVDPPSLISPPEARSLPVPIAALPARPLIGQPGKLAPGAATAARRRRCPGARRRTRRSPQALRAARVATLCLLNASRRKFRLPRLRGNPRLLRAAEGHSRSMVQLGYFSHVEPGGVGLVDRVLRAGYLIRVTKWTVGENLGFGIGPASSPKAMMRAWMASTGHRANILNGRYNEVGLGVVQGVPRNRRRGATFTTVFGRRR